MYKVTVYEDKNGESEIESYLKNLKSKYSTSKDSRIKYNKIVSYLDLLKEKGTTLGEPYMKHLDNDIWELRPLRDRILFAYWKDNTFILLSLFMKDTRKTPPREIERAKSNLQEFIKRSEDNE
jgi:phage-related protein